MQSFCSVKNCSALDSARPISFCHDESNTFSSQQISNEHISKDYFFVYDRSILHFKGLHLSIFCFAGLLDLQHTSLLPHRIRTRVWRLRQQHHLHFVCLLIVWRRPHIWLRLQAWATQWESQFSPCHKIVLIVQHPCKAKSLLFIATPANHHASFIRFWATNYLSGRTSHTTMTIFCSSILVHQPATLLAKLTRQRTWYT